MYEVIKDNEVICEITNVCYVKYHAQIDSWCICNVGESEAIWVVPNQKEGEEQKQSFYARLFFHPVSEFPLVEIKKIETVNS